MAPLPAVQRGWPEQIALVGPCALAVQVPGHVNTIGFGMLVSEDVLDLALVVSDQFIPQPTLLAPVGNESYRAKLEFPDRVAAGLDRW